MPQQAGSGRFVVTVGLVEGTITKYTVPRLGDDSQYRRDNSENVLRREEIRRCRRASASSHAHGMLPKCSASTASASFMPAERVQKRICAGLIRYTSPGP